mmetsp:Transcript_18376/g.37947  ORF Transcript_18376/g.37947 Transcript_18376/m.37947 type:complete len:283 (-) Transcript_18376:916-1764(-)
MHIGVHISWRVKLDDEINVLNVNTPCSNVSRYQDIECTSSERIQCRITLLLTNVTMERLGCQTLEHATRHKFVSLTFRFCENNGLSENLLLHSTTALLFLFGSRGRNCICFINFCFVVSFRDFDGNDVFEDGTLRFDTRWELDSHMADGCGNTSTTFVTCSIDSINVRLVFCTDLFDPWWGCSREEEALSCVFVRNTNILQNYFNIFCKTHVKHFIGFIQYSNVTFTEIQIAAVHMIHDTAGCPDQDIDTTPQSTGLRFVGNTTVEHFYEKSQGASHTTQFF